MTKDGSFRTNSKSNSATRGKYQQSFTTSSDRIGTYTNVRPVSVGSYDRAYNTNITNSTTMASNHNTQYPSSHHTDYQTTSSNFISSSAHGGMHIGYANQYQPNSNIKTIHPSFTSSSVTGNSSSKLRETIHSGQFMVSDFEPESEVLDEEYEAGMPIPCVTDDDSNALQFGTSIQNGASQTGLRSRGQTVSVITMNQKSSVPSSNDGTLVPHRALMPGTSNRETHAGSPIIDGSLTKLFQCMSLAYRQKLTSPKWNPFRGVRLRWKDKIRLNNVIWRCWHMQFILKQKAMVCQFASPLDVDQHNKPEAVVMEGKYWKRKLSTVAAEYKKWRLFYRNRIMGWTHHHPVPDLHPVSLDGFDWNRPGNFGNGAISNLVIDDELLMDFSDTLFSSLTSQPFAFPNPRELSRAGMVADFIQPGLVQLQPNLEDFMDTLEPFQEYVNPKFLAPVPEELDGLDTSHDVLLGGDLASLMHHRIQQQSLFSRNNLGMDSLHDNFSTHSDPGQSSLFYSINQLEVNNRHIIHQSPPSQPTPSAQSPSSSPLQTTITSVQTQSSPTTALLKDTQKPVSKNPLGYSTNVRDDIFAIPKGKPRGRSRSGNRNRDPSNTQPSQPMSPLVPITQQTTQPIHMIAHNQLSASMSNSHTLLSHLLTTSGSGHGHYATTNTGGLEKAVSQNPSSHLMMTQSNESPTAMSLPGTLIDIQQHQQPWNPKNANETISPNMSLNFGAKSLIQGASNQNGNMAGGSSPTLLPNTPSPPMGPLGGMSSGPPSPPKLFRGKSDNDREHRRVCHINAEQKRRCNIKNGFDMLHSLIPQLSHNPNAKVSKAAMLQKGAEYIRQLKVERARLKQEIETHRQEVEVLNSAINNCQSMLPATGAPVSRQRTNKMKEMFEQWVRLRTLENWKFWLFSILVRPLLDSYNNAVSTASLDELCRTVLSWIDQHCSLVDLRPAVLNSLRYLCTTTDILTNPANLPEEANRAVNRVEIGDRSNSDSTSR